MAKKNIIQTISEKEMNRKDFLRYSGVLLLGVVGLKGLATLIATPEKVLSSTNNNDKRGFGSGKYGV